VNKKQKEKEIKNIELFFDCSHCKGIIYADITKWKIKEKQKYRLMNKEKYPELFSSVQTDVDKAKKHFLGLRCEKCNWRGTFDETKGRGGYFAVCPKCNEPEPEEALLEIVLEEKQ